MAKNSPLRDSIHDYNPKVNADSEDNPANIDKAVITPLLNPLKSYRLSTNLYNSIKALKSNLHKYTT